MVLRIARSDDRDCVVQVINAVAGERQYLQTDYYRPTPFWEQALSDGINYKKQILLLVLEDEYEIVGFSRLFPDQDYPNNKLIGNIGISLLPNYRSNSFGTIMLKHLLSYGFSLGFQDVTADVLASNVRSLRLFEKAGFCSIESRFIWLSYNDRNVEEVKLKKRLIVGEE